MKGRELLKKTEPLMMAQDIRKTSNMMKAIERKFAFWASRKLKNRSRKILG